MINRKQAEAAVQQHGTIFFDYNLQPVVPAAGMWFCEFDDEYSHDPEVLRDEAIVEYIGPCDSKVYDSAIGGFAAYGAPEFRHVVAESAEDGTRRPRGTILIKQN